MSNRKDTNATTTTAPDTSTEELRWDLGTLFPSKGDPRRPPEWFGRALLYVAIAIVLFMFCWRSWGDISYLVLDLVISLFLALAVEPMALALIRHGWKRGIASFASLMLVAVILVVLLALFGNMFVQQVIAMVKGVPAMYEQLREFVAAHTTRFSLPDMNNLWETSLNEIQKNLQSSWVTNFAGTAMSTAGGVFSFLLNLMIVIMMTFYISAAGPRLRRAACQWMAPAAQRRFLFVWTVSQDQISSFLFSRSILALCNATATAICLYLLHVPYWLPLALFCGVTSQFIPMLGTYLGGALPVLVAWSDRGLIYAIIVLVFICVYQQIENFILSPKISQRTMDINEAIAFLAVLAFGSLFGALGAFLALPLTAAIQTIFRAYTRRYELVDSPLMDDPKPEKKSKIVEASEAFSEHVIEPIADRMPRAAKGSTNHVPMNDEIRLLQKQIYEGGVTEDDGTEEGATMAIPKHVLEKTARHGLTSVQGTADETEHGAASKAASDETHHAATTLGNAMKKSSALADVVKHVEDEIQDADGSAADAAHDAASDVAEEAATTAENVAKTADEAAKSADNPRAGWR